MLTTVMTPSLHALQGRVPLHSAAAQDNVTAVKWLLHHGANSAAKDAKVSHDGSAPKCEPADTHMQQLYASKHMLCGTFILL